MADTSQFIVAKAQTSPDKFIDSSMRTYDAMNTKGKERPFNYSVAVGQCRGWVYAACRMNAAAVASTPLRMYVRKRGGDRLVGGKKVGASRKQYLCGNSKRTPSRYVINKTNEWGGEFEEAAERTPIIELLEKPNPWMLGFDFSMMRSLFLQLTGNFYMHPVVESARVAGQGVNRVKELWIAPSQYVKIVPAAPHTGEWVKEYIYGVDSQAERHFPPDEICHMKLPNPGNQWYGLGVVEAGWNVLKINAAQMETDQAKYDNHARPDLAVITKSMNGTVQQLNEMQNEWARIFRGTFKQGSPVFLTGDTQVIPLNWMPSEMGAREIVIEEIAAVTGVPVSLIKANDPNLASASVGFASWRENTTLPYCRMDEEFLNNSLLPIYAIEGDAFLAYDDPVPENRDEIRQDIMGLVGKVWTVNEGREKLGDAPLDDENADKLLVASGSVPLDKVGEPPPMPAGGLPMNDFKKGFEHGRDGDGGDGNRGRGLLGDGQDRAAPRITVRQVRPSRVVKQSDDIYSAHHKSVDGGDQADTAREGEPETPIAKMTKAIAAVFEKQRKAIQAALVGRKAIPDTTLADLLATITKFAPDLVQAIAPYIEAQTVAGGAAGLLDIGLPADAFSVVNPAVRDFIDKYTINLAHEINGYTTERLSETLGEGLEAGEATTTLAARVGALYDDFTGYRCEMIARTESARAFVAGTESAWKDSGVVEGKTWELANSACPICAAIAYHFQDKSIPLGQPFYPLGSVIPLGNGKTYAVDYAPIMGPPAHPYCRCGITATLSESDE